MAATWCYLLVVSQSEGGQGGHLVLPLSGQSESGRHGLAGSNCGSRFNSKYWWRCNICWQIIQKYAF